MGRLIDAVVELAKEALGVTELQAKLRACSDACELSEDAEPLKPGDPAWSHAYEDVADLRRAWLREVEIVSRRSRENTKLCSELNEAKARLTEHEKKSNERRLDLVAIANALGCSVVKEKMLERIAELKGGNVPAQAFTVKVLPPGQVFETSSDGGKTWYECPLGNSYRSDWLTRMRPIEPNDGKRAGAFARSVNADPNAPMTATVKGGAVSLKPVAVGPAKPMWGDWKRVEFVSSASCYFRSPPPYSTGIVARQDHWQDARGVKHYATDIDDAREKADAHLVGIGGLEAGRAFKRLGDWRSCGGGVLSRELDWRMVGVVDEGGWFVTDVRMHNDDDGPTVRGAETGDASKEAADAELVRRDLLDPSRAFKAGPR